MRPEELEAYEKALRVKWEAERVIDDLREKILRASDATQGKSSPEAIPGPPLQVGDTSQTLPFLPGPNDSDLQILDSGGPPIFESKYAAVFKRFFADHPNEVVSTEQVVEALGPEKSAAIASALVRAANSGLITRVKRGHYKFTEGQP